MGYEWSPRAFTTGQVRRLSIIKESLNTQPCPSGSTNNVLCCFVHKFHKSLPYSVMIHIVAQDQTAYACITRKTCPLRKAFALLSSIETHYMRANMPANANSIVASCLQDAARATDKIDLAHQGIDEVKTEVLNNIEKVLGNADQLNQVIESTSALQTSAFQFKQKAETLKWKQLMVLASLFAALVCIVCFIVLIIVIVFVIVYFVTQKKEEDPPQP